MTEFLPPTIRQADKPTSRLGLRPTVDPEIVVRPAVGKVCGGRVPQAGMAVHFWMKDAIGRLECRPATLFAYDVVSGNWDLNVTKFGGVYGQRSTGFSEMPKDCYWSWPADDGLVRRVDVENEIADRIAAKLIALGYTGKPADGATRTEASA